MTPDEHLAHHDAWDAFWCSRLSPRVVRNDVPDEARQLQALRIVLRRKPPANDGTTVPEPPAHEDDAPTTRPAVRRKPARRANRELARLLREARGKSQEAPHG